MTKMNVVCKVTVRVDDEFFTYTGKTVEGIKSLVTKQFPGSKIQLGKPVWVEV